MTSIERISEYNNELYLRGQVRISERKQEDLRLEERRAKQIREVSEQARIEMNRRMNRPGQNVDKLC
jgi:hypothetical protein